MSSHVDYIVLTTGKMLFVKYESISDEKELFKPPTDLTENELIELYELLIKVFTQRLNEIK